MTAPSPSNQAAHARQRVLARVPSPSRLPLGRDGQPLRRRLREATDDQRARLVAAWFDALHALHAGGFGAEDAVAAAIVTVNDRVVLLPDLVWPLGSLCGRRPTARWLDLADAHAWLAEVDPDRALTPPEPPWPGFPALPGGGPAAIVGPPLEVAALARHAGLPCLPAAHLATPRGRAWAARALEAGAAWIIPLADARDARHVRLLPSRVVLARALGAAPPVAPEDVEALDQEPDLLVPPEAEARRGPDPAALARALESAPLVAGDAARDEATARALLAAMEAGQDRELLDQPARFEAIVDLARRAGARELTLRAVLARGLGRLADASADERELGRADLVEARRLAQAAQSDALVVLADAAAVLAAALERDPRAEPDPREVADGRALAWRTVARVAAQAARDEARSALAKARVILGLGLLEGEPTLLGLAIEVVGRAGVVRGAEAEAERVLGELARQSPPRPIVPLLLAWQALLAARRGAPLTARDHLLELGALLDAARLHTVAGARDRWAQRAAGRAALAARVLGMDGLVSHFGAAARGSRAARVASAPSAAVDSAAELPTWLLVAAAELARDLPESRLRQARQALRARLERLDADDLPAGAMLALGRLDAAAGAWELARRGLAVASAGGEPHVEREALTALAAVLSQSGERGDEVDAVARRLDQLRARALPPGLEDAPTPLSHEAREAGVTTLVARASAAGAEARRGGGDAWLAAVEALCGPVSGALFSHRSAATGLALAVSPTGDWQLAAGDGATVTLTAPALDAPPSAVAAALRALAPLLGARGPGAPTLAPSEAKAWAAATHEALLAGEVTFDDAVVAPFRAHDLTREGVRALLHLGLTDAGGLYKTLAAAWHVAEGDYQRFMDFLRRANAALDYRAYRRVPR